MKNLIVFLTLVLFCFIFSVCERTMDPISGNEIEPNDLPKIVFNFNARNLYESDDIFMMDLLGNNLTNLTKRPGEYREKVFSTDGSKIAYVSDLGGPSRIFLIDIDQGSEEILTNDIEHAWQQNPKFSPDGSKILFVNVPYSDDGYIPPDIYIMDINGANKRWLANGLHCSFSPDGARVIYTMSYRWTHGVDSMNIEIVDVSGGEKSIIRTFHPSLSPSYSQELRPGSLKFFPNNDIILLTAGKYIPPDYKWVVGLYTLELDGTNLQILVESWGGGDPIISPDGQKIIGAAGSSRPAVGELGGHDIFIVNSDGTNRKILTNENRDNRDPKFTYDSKHIIYSALLDSVFTYDIFIMDINGDNKIDLFHQLGYATEPITQ